MRMNVGLRHGVTSLNVMTSREDTPASSRDACYLYSFYTRTLMVCVVFCPRPICRLSFCCMVDLGVVTLSTLVATLTRNVLDYDQSNHSSHIIFSYTFTLEQNTNWIGWTVAEIMAVRSKFYKMRGRSVGRRSSIYTLKSCTPLHYVRNVAREE